MEELFLFMPEGFPGDRIYRLQDTDLGVVLNERHKHCREDRRTTFPMTSLQPWVGWIGNP
ncbi:hypothetical protein GRAN_2337 [Granulicella sibirica]|uniref:Uncharacterized protein n=1 Tax=Granulicella sibirica TaxID=2479048 RepID=A0A4Q0SZL3_9BACT|nr:hypothetical protein GRAN_2337 [Granulicella sibirica]